MRLAIYDSGVGGLSIYQAVSAVLPQHEIVFLSDNQAFPYGTKSDTELLDRITLVTSALIEHYSPDIVILACNTASTIGLAVLREMFDVEFIGVVPAIKPAAESSETGKIAVLATEATVRRDYTKNLVDEHAEGLDVDLIAASSLVSLAEAKIRGEFVDLAELESVLQPISSNKTYDTLVLACTHFPLLKSEIEDALGPDSSIRNIIDSSAAIARRSQAVVAKLESPTTYTDQAENEGLIAKRSAVFTKSEQWSPEFLAYLEKLGFEQIDLINV